MLCALKLHSRLVDSHFLTQRPPLDRIRTARRSFPDPGLSNDTYALAPVEAADVGSR